MGIISISMMQSAVPLACRLVFEMWYLFTWQFLYFLHYFVTLFLVKIKGSYTNIPKWTTTFPPYKCSCFDVIRHIIIRGSAQTGNLKIHEIFTAVLRSPHDVDHSLRGRWKPWPAVLNHLGILVLLFPYSQ